LLQQPKPQLADQVIRAITTPSPKRLLNRRVFPIVSISDPPLLVDTKVGVIIALEVEERDTEVAFEVEPEIGDVEAETDIAEPGTEEIFGLELEFADVDAEVVEVAEPRTEEAELGEDTEEEAGADIVVGVALEVTDETGVVGLGLGLGLGLELEPEPPAGTTTPPCILPTDWDDEVPAALAL